MSKIKNNKYNASISECLTYGPTVFADPIGFVFYWCCCFLPFTNGDQLPKLPEGGKQGSKAMVFYYENALLTKLAVVLLIY